MKKIFMWLMVILLASTSFAQRTGKSLTKVRVVDGNVVHTIQSGWVIAESENSADTQTDALGVTERTKKRLDTVIAANANEEEFISIFLIPPEWNVMRGRGVGITDGDQFTHQLYLGTLDEDLDCEFTYTAQFLWTVGTQSSIYDQIGFTLGGAGNETVPRVGDNVTGNTSGETATIVSISALSSGAWADGDAAGTITYKSASGTFTGLETVTIARAGINLTTNGFTHANSDLIDFEMADTLTTTAKSWGGTITTTSPVGNTNAEFEVDVKGSNIAIVVTTATTSDSKLLLTGF